MTDKDQEKQELIYTETKSPFKIGDKVRPKTQPDFHMHIVDFDTEWVNDLSKLYKFKNPEYPLCKYYNTKTDKWVEKQRFHYLDIEIDNSDNTPSPIL